jgi:hypothetical protein
MFGDSLYKGAIRPWLVDSRKFVSRAFRLRSFNKQFAEFRSLLGPDSSSWPTGATWPCLDDMGDAAGSAKGHYFHQDLYVAQQVFNSNPKRHLDIGSRVDGFVAHLASFREIDVLDIRPLRSPNRRIRFQQGDLMDPEFVSNLGRWDSVSCLHALEHFGLGRYGDRIDPDGWQKGLHSLAEVTEQGGTLYLSVPIGPQRIEFNAHRVFSVETILGAVEGLFGLKNFVYVNDFGDLIEFEGKLTSEIVEHLAHVYYGCGIFTFERVLREA